MPRNNDTEYPFFARLSTFMVTNDVDIFAAATELELGLTSAECQRLLKNKGFLRVLRTARLKAYTELANDPDQNKDSLIGKGIYCVDRLMDDQQYDKALSGILSLAKIQGYVGADSTVNVFAGLNTKDMEALKAKLKNELPLAQA
jgi:hypothetical protein